MPFKRREQRRTFLNILPHLPQHVLEERVLLLLGQDIDTLHERQTGVDHDRELSRKDGKLLGLDPLAAAELGDRDLAALFRGLRHYDLLSSQKSTELVLVGGVFFAGDEFIEAVSSFEGVCWHFLSSI